MSFKEFSTAQKVPSNDQQDEKTKAVPGQPAASPVAQPAKPAEDPKT